MGVARSQFRDASGPSTCSCWSAFEKIRGNEVAHYAQQREDFELMVSFLASVPLFSKQLPRSELPKVAQSMTRRVWKPGRRLVRQGDIGREFFLIQQGEASVSTSLAPGEPEQERATLYPGDYFGGHTLMIERPNVATIIAKGSAPLVTLSMSRQRFEESGLKFRLRFPKRSAVCDGGQYEEGLRRKLTTVLELPPQEVDFICSSVRRNGNLRALLEEASDDILRAIAAGAQKRYVPKGEMFAEAGTVGQELFIVRAGAIDAVIPDSVDINGNHSAEGVLANSTMAERLLRKEHSLNQIFRTASIPLRKLEGRHRSQSQEFSPNRRRSSVRHPKGQEQQVAESHDTATKSPSNAIRRSFGRQPKQGSKAASRDAVLPIEALSECSLADAPSCPVTPRTPRRETPRRRSSASDLGSLSPQHLRRSARSDFRLSGRSVTFGVGESFGELSLIYNIKGAVDLVASEDSVIYAIDRRHFTTWFCGRSQRFYEYTKILEEVYALSQLLSSERWELACRAQGLVEFRPGERVLSQAKPREARLWYVIWSGSAVVTYTEQLFDGTQKTSKLADLYRAGHFGERSLLRGDEASQVTVDAGPEGVCCLTFDGETVLPILRDIFEVENNLVPSPTVGIKEWCRGKNKGWDHKVVWEQQVSWGRQISSQSTGWNRRNSTQDGSCGARHLKLQDLQHIVVLGRGGFGQVILVEDPSNAQYYALKTISKGHVKKRRAERQIKWEREILSMLDSKFIVELHKTFQDDRHVHFLLEAALGGNLMEVLHLHSEVLLEDQPRGYAAAFYVGCLTLALEHMHERRIVHRDVKPENALLDARGYVKLCDMGFARFVLGKTNTRVGTPDYMAPEMIDFPHTHDMSVDWWALGVLTFELLAGQTPWEDEGISDPMERLLAIRRSQGGDKVRFPYHFPQPARTFVSSLLLPAKQRLGAAGGAAAVKEHKMFAAAGISFRDLETRRLQSPYLPEEEYQGLVMSDGDDLCPGPGDSIYGGSFDYSNDEEEDDWGRGF